MLKQFRLLKHSHEILFQFILHLFCFCFLFGRFLAAI